MYTALDLRPSLDDSPGVSFEPIKKSKLRESKPLRYASTDTESSFDDTFRELPAVREQRLREAEPWKFERGVPTNGKTSSRNYSDDDTKIIDGEHKTLLALGKITEAVDSDDHDTHIREHRLQLSDPKLSETQRMGLMEHIAMHVKQRGAKIKAVQKEAKEKSKGREDITKNKGYGHGVGMLSRSLPANTDDQIPQDQQVDLERKRTAGNLSMESRESRLKNFRASADRIYGRRRSL